MAPPIVTDPPAIDETVAESTGSLRSLDAARLWRSNAPGPIRQAWRNGDSATAWSALRQHLAASRDLDKAELDSLQWGTVGPTTGNTETLVTDLRSARSSDQAESALARWAATDSVPLPSIDYALGAVAIGMLAPRLATVLEADEWWTLIESLRHLVDEASASAAPEATEAEAVVVHQLLAGELPLVLSKSLADLKPMHELASISRSALTEAIERLTDGEGLLTAPLWIDPQTPAASLLFACWTRCLTHAADGKRPWSGDAQTQYEWFVRQALRASDSHGRLAFSPAGLAGTEELIRAAIVLGADESDHAAAVDRLRRFKGDDSFESPDSSNHSEWAEIGVLASSWRDKSPRIVVAHPGDQTFVEIRSDKQTLLAGEWPIDVQIAGAVAKADDSWDVQCWYSDDECDFLEIAIELEGGAKLERQLFLAREDRVGFVAEVLFSGSDEPIDLKIASRLPLGDGVAVRPDRETRDAALTANGNPAAGLLPLALAEWRDERRGGELTASQRTLLLTREANARNLCSYLWIDFAPRRFEKQRTWRQLAVAQSLKNVTQDVAVGYRVQSAKDQWLVYRSLDAPANRTVLGQNLASEALVGRFRPPNGNVDEYFEIEADVT